MSLTTLTSADALPGILHICSAYAKQRVYAELVSELSSIGLRQFVYVPVRSVAELQKDAITDRVNLNHRFSLVLKPYHRVLFRTKVRALVRDLARNVDVGNYQVVHAHFLYSDGAVARRIQKLAGLPYVVAVRNTDINFFMRLRPDLRWICWDILRHASRIICINPAYLETLFRDLPSGVAAEVRRKADIVPNGIDCFWLNDSGPLDRAGDELLRILYVGDFSGNKNIVNAMRAVRIVDRQVPAILTLVGGGGSGEREVDRLIASREYPFVKRLGRINSREVLRDVYRSHDLFLMPSFRETFGLVYVEALSQGLPIVHSAGQGIDGYFPLGTVAESVNPSSPESIAEGIVKAASRLPGVRRQCSAAAAAFAWNAIGKKYKQIYLTARASSTRHDL